MSAPFGAAIQRAAFHQENVHIIHENDLSFIIAKFSLFISFLEIPLMVSPHLSLFRMARHVSGHNYYRKDFDRDHF